MRVIRVVLPVAERALLFGARYDSASAIIRTRGRTLVQALSSGQGALGASAAIGTGGGIW